MVDVAPVVFAASYDVKNLPAVARLLRGFPEFLRGTSQRDAEEYVWMAPQRDGYSQRAMPVATVRLSGQTLRIECPKRHALRAMQVLMDSLMGAQIRLQVVEGSEAGA